jgi:NADH-quinone oxidoreductase subunit L
LPAHVLAPGTEWALIALSVVAAIAGIVIAFRLYLQSPASVTALQERFSFLHRAWLNKYWVDEFYDTVVVRPLAAFANWCWRFWDIGVVDGTVNGVGYTLEGASALLRLFQTGFVGTYALFFALGVAALLLHFLRH